MVKKSKNNHKNRFHETFREQMEAINKQKDLKIVDLDGDETYGSRQEENTRVIEFENKIDLVVEQHWKSALGKQQNNKFVVHDALQLAEEIEDETEIKNDTEEGVRTKQLCIVIDTSTMHNKMGVHQRQ